MTVTDIGVVISLLVSVFVAGWTVYRDVIQKPKFRVSFGIAEIFQEGVGTSEPFLEIEALNLGPIPNRLGLPQARKSWWARNIQREQYPKIFIRPDHQHLATTWRAERVEVGDKMAYAIPFNADCFLKEEGIVDVGVVDGFGRRHWAPRRQVRKARDSFARDFPATG